MSTATLTVLLIVNTVISMWDAYIAGRTWKESTGFRKAIAWAALTMSVCGFVMVTSYLGALGSREVGLITQTQYEMVLELAYILMIIPTLGAGLAITTQTWIDTVKRRSLVEGSVAGWNSFALVTTTVDALENSGGLSDDIVDYFKGKDEDKDVADKLAKGGVVTILVLAAALSVGLTYLFWNRGRLRSITVEIEEARNRAFAPNINLPDQQLALTGPPRSM